MKIRWISILLLLALAACSVFAHGDKVHVVGTVEKTTSDSLVVKTKDGKSVEVKLAASTAYLERINNQDKPAKLDDVAPGDFVVIHATPKATGLERPGAVLVAVAQSGRSRRAEAETLKKFEFERFLLVDHMAGMCLKHEPDFSPRRQLQ
jgi:hypothetical protein